MDTLDRPLLDQGARDGPVVMPALRKLLVLTCSEDTDQQVEAVIGISEVVRRRTVDLSSFGPLCHILTRLVASEHQSVVAYAARSMRHLVQDDALRSQASRAGIPSVLAAALVKRQGDTACLREVVGALQTLCYDETTALEVIDTGALGSVLQLLDTSELELRLLSMATLANVLAFSDTLLLTREKCVGAIRDRMGVVVGAAKQIGRQQRLASLAVVALANGCAHHALAERAKELEVPEVFAKLSKEIEFDVVKTAMSRLNGHGDVEVGTVGREESGYPLQFFRIKSGTRVSLLRVSVLSRRVSEIPVEEKETAIFLVVLGTCFSLSCIVLVVWMVCC